MNGRTHCELCDQVGGVELWRSGACRIVRVPDTGYPGFCRVIWNDHVKEMTDLEVADRQALMRVVFAVEDVVRRLYCPDKINLASFGNMVPHVHWHIIPRWNDDRHFPEPIWGAIRRDDNKLRPEIPDDVLKLALQAELAPIAGILP